MALIDDFRKLYSDFNQQTLSGIEAIYAQEVIFKDPIHEVKGLPALVKYFESVGAGLRDCRFEFESCEINDNSAFCRWLMHYTHPKLNSGQALTLRGASFLKFDQKIYYHEDYYDMGAMVYEQLPLLKYAIRSVKNRLKR